MFSALPHWYCHHKHPNPFFRHYKKVMTYFGDLNWTIISKTFSFSNLVSIRFVDMVYKIHQNHVIIQWYDKCFPRYFQGSQLFMSYLLSKLSEHSPCWHRVKLLQQHLLLYTPLFVRFNEHSHFGDKDMTAYESLIKILQWWPRQCLKDLCQVCGIHKPIRAKSFSNSYDYTLIILVPLILILHVTSLNLVKTVLLGMKLKHGFSATGP